MPRREDLPRFLAPAAFLVVVTVAVLLIRAGLQHGGSGGTPPAASAPTTTAARTQTASHAPTTRPTSTSAVATYYTVQSGDTYGSIAARFGTTAQQLEQLNPGVSPNALSIGQRIRVK